MGPQVIELEPIKDANKRKANAKRSRECYLEMKEMDIFEDDAKMYSVTHMWMQKNAKLQEWDVE